MRLIDADKLKQDDELTQWLSMDAIRTGKMLKMFSELFVKKIDEQPTICCKDCMWIPVSERLPDLDDYTGSMVWQKEVLITGYLSFDSRKELFVTEALARDVVYNSVHDTIVIAWMPLPKPYEVESEE